MSQPDPLTATLMGRFRGTLRGAALGVGMFALAFPLLLWNEGSTIVAVQSYNAQLDRPVSVVTDPVQSVNEDRLVHMTGDIAPVATIVDPEFGLSLPVLKLQRQAETYQWIELRTADGKPEATYAKAWRNEIVDSAHFVDAEQHKNPDKARFGDWESSSGKARLGAFDLPTDLVDRYNPFATYPLSQDDLKPLVESIRKEARLHDGLLYFSRDPAKPAVGDSRIRYVAVRTGKVSVLGRQSGSTLAPFYTQTGYRVYQLRSGAITAETMYAEAAPGTLLSLSTFLTFLFRFAAWLGMALGILIALERVGVWGESVPIVRDMLAPGHRPFAVAVSAGLCLLTIGFAWTSYTWVRGGLLMALGAAVLVALYRWGHGLRSQPTA